LGDSGLGGMSLAQCVEHDKVVDHSGVADRGYGHARCTKLVTVCLALVAQHIGFAVDDESWRQALEVFEGGVQRGGRDLGALGGVGRVLVPEPHHVVAAQEIAFRELRVRASVEVCVRDGVEQHLSSETHAAALFGEEGEGGGDVPTA
jgi:hypothetical protein